MGKKKSGKHQVVGIELLESVGCEIVEVTMTNGDKVQVGKIREFGRRWVSTCYAGYGPPQGNTHATRMLAITSILNKRFTL